MTKIQMFETTPGDQRRGYAVVLVIVYWRLIFVCNLFFVIWDFLTSIIRCV
ncbi:hypothetical protein D1AOALGA4SA_1569 [Olavius algarvensis Delta 1 endosymbiont]|nr:hypothetical protein D1AOALGA4SA_1569 [Olavius algarvensis Delta 1 endosymbiont]